MFGVQPSVSGVMLVQSENDQAFGLLRENYVRVQ